MLFENTFSFNNSTQAIAVIEREKFLPYKELIDAYTVSLSKIEIDARICESEALN